MPTLPKAVDLSRGMPPEDFFVCFLEDRHQVEQWRESNAALNTRIPSSNWCAMTCLRMTLLAEGREAPTLRELFDMACLAGVYTWKENDSGWFGAIHDKLADFIQDEFGFDVLRREDMTPTQVARALAEGYYAHLSVGPAIRYPDVAPTKRNGHFVFAYAYRKERKRERTFFIHNAAGFASLNSQVSFPVPESRLNELFSGKAILVKSKR